jgi:transposase-like protein
VRWYLSSKLSFRDLVAIRGERGIALAQTTILHGYSITLRNSKSDGGDMRAVDRSWRMDENYVKVRAEWVYLYRAVDKSGKMVDFYLSRKRDVNAAKAFLRKAMKDQRQQGRSVEAKKKPDETHTSPFSLDTACRCEGWEQGRRQSYRAPGHPRAFPFSALK